MAAMTFGCPRCGMQMSLDDQYAGMQIQCPGCRTPFMAPRAQPAAAPAAPPPPQTPPPRTPAMPPAGADAGPGYTIRAIEAPPVSGASLWRTARVGFALQMFGWFGGVAAAALAFLHVVMLDKNFPEQAANFINAAKWAMFGAGGFLVLGSGFAIAAPSDGGVKAPAAIALVMLLTGVGLAVSLEYDWVRREETVVWIALAAGGLGAAIVVLALKAAADRFCRNSSVKIIINLIVLVVLCGGIVALRLTERGGGTVSQGMVGFMNNIKHVLPMAGLMYCVWTFFLTGKVKNSLGRAAPPKPKFGSYRN